MHTGAKSLRIRLEEVLHLTPGSLKARKKEFSQLIGEVLNEDSHVKREIKQILHREPELRSYKSIRTRLEEVLGLEPRSLKSLALIKWKLTTAHSNNSG